MSAVPNDTLQPADSLNMRTFGTMLQIDSSSTVIDMVTRYQAYWKSCIIRNYQISIPLFYRTERYGTFHEVKPNSELPIKGWGSYLEITSTATPANGVVDFECVKLQEASNA